jgi:hypothetical protein
MTSPVAIIASPAMTVKAATRAAYNRQSLALLSIIVLESAPAR